MPTLDTNILVRFLAQDNDKQSALATDCIQSHENDESLFIPLTVVVELEWVLRTSYQLPKTELIALFGHLLETRQIKFHEEELVERAIHLYRHSKADFADCLHLACSDTQSAFPMMTFDKKAARLNGVELLTTT